MNNSAPSAGRPAERAGALTVPAHDRGRRRAAQHDAAPVARAVAHVERAQPGALARRQESATLQARELLAAQARVAEHPDDRQIAAPASASSAIRAFASRSSARTGP